MKSLIRSNACLCLVCLISLIAATHGKYHGLTVSFILSWELVLWFRRLLTMPGIESQGTWLFLCICGVPAHLLVCHRLPWFWVYYVTLPCVSRFKWSLTFEELWRLKNNNLTLIRCSCSFLQSQNSEGRGR